MKNDERLINKMLDLDESIRSIEKQYICFICSRKAENPKMTCCCGKIACEECLNNVFMELHHCPNCNRKPSKIYTTSMTWIDDLEKLILLISSGSSQSICPKHAKKCKFYCDTCDEFICSDCILDELSLPNKYHENHKIIKIDQYFAPIKMKIQDELVVLKQTIETSNHILKSLELNMEQIDAEKNDTTLELLRTFHVIVDKFKKEYDETMKQDNIDEQIKIMNDVKNELIDMKTECKSVKKKDSLILTKSTKLIQDYRDHIRPICEKIISFNLLAPINIPNCIIPPFQYITIKYPDFQNFRSSFKEASGESNFILSSPYSIGVNIWRIKLYPNGNGNGVGRYLSLFIGKDEGVTESLPYEYKVEIQNSDPESLFVKQYISDFAYKEYWGWNKLIQFKALKNGYIKEDGSLELKIGIRTTTYYLLDKEICAMNKKMKNKINTLQSMINQAKSKENKE